MNKISVSQTLLILGRNPTISIAEIRAKFPQAKICAREKEFAIFEGIEMIDLKKIGGVVKVGKVFARSMQYSQSNLKDKDVQQIYDFLEKEFLQKTGKQVFGFSVYPADSKTLKTLLIGAKKFLQKKGIASRFANKNFTNLTNPQSEFEILKKGGVEILAVRGSGNWFFARLKQNQPFDDYKKRDYEKAFRDARVGMLPPKLAIMMVNLGVGGLGEIEKHGTWNLKHGTNNEKLKMNNEENLVNDSMIQKENLNFQNPKLQTTNYKLPTVYDPFCGVGGILVEAALLGCRVVGSDLDPRMVEFSQKNLAALNLPGEVFVHDAKEKLNESEWKKYDVVVSEGYLGPPRRTVPEEKIRAKIFAELQQLYQKFFAWLTCRRVVICFPIYLEAGIPKYFASREILPTLKEMGWEMKNTEKLIYSRENQTVGREIVVLEK
ncbi:MAG: methyltransferase domain-containing protein [Patescibacteria group bacterium]